ncbi:placenta growth factor isoform 3-T3 [Vipera latastei]
MQLLRGFLVALALHMVGAQKKDVVLQNSTTERAVVSFFDVWNRSSCQPLEKLLKKINPENQLPFMELSFTEHRKCECRPRQDALKSGRRRRLKGRSKKKRAKQRPKN